MIETVSITNPSLSTLSLDLITSGVDEGLVIFNLDGLGPPKANIAGLGGPNSDGITVSTIRTDARHLVLTLAIHTGFNEEIAKQKIYTYFPIGEEVSIRIETATKDVYATAIVESIEMNSFAKIENAVISLYCAYPYWLDWTESNPSISSGGTVVSYSGEKPTGVLITIDFTGSVYGDLTIYNSLGGGQELFIDWTYLTSGEGGPGLPTQNGDSMVIDTRIGQKSIWYYRTQSYNLFKALGTDTEWLTLFPGSNTISWAAGGGGSYMSLDLTYRKVYDGV